MLHGTVVIYISSGGTYHGCTKSRYVYHDQPKESSGRQDHSCKRKDACSDESKFNLLTTVDIKDTITLLLISIFLGGLGIDRFMLGDIGMGILKLLTGGVCGILTIIDWFTVQNRTRELNYNNIMMVL